MNKTSYENLTRGIFKENPIFVMLLGMCPTLGVTTTALNGMGMGLATLFVLLMSNCAISAVKHIIPEKIRIPCFILIAATFVTVADLLISAYFPTLHATLGIFIPLIVVNCLILGRAEAFASKNTVFQSALDAIGMGIGFTLALTLLGLIRETLGNGSALGWKFVSEDAETMMMFIMPPGAFLALAGLIIIINQIRKDKK